MHPLLLLLSASLLAAPAPPSEPSADKLPSATALPGTVVRWSGEGTERCGRGDEEWAPLAGVCWYAVDLEAPQGTITVHRRRAGVREDARIAVGDYPYPTQSITLQDDSKVHLSQADLERSERESTAVRELWARRGAARFALPLAPPLARLPAAGRFGSRRLFNGEARSPHSGADFAVPAGTPVLATADGTVALAAEHFFSGNSVFLDHGDGLISMYFHLTKIEVKPGQEVKRGQRLGTVGSTGRATGPHLHFGIRWRGARVDPEILLGNPDKPPSVR